MQLSDKEIAWHHQFVQKYMAMPLAERPALIERFATHMYNELRTRHTKEMSEKNPEFMNLIKSFELI
jgi:hypothetical protein